MFEASRILSQSAPQIQSGRGDVRLYRVSRCDPQLDPYRPALVPEFLLWSCHVQALTNESTASRHATVEEKASRSYTMTGGTVMPRDTARSYAAFASATPWVQAVAGVLLKRGDRLEQGACGPTQIGVKPNPGSGLT